MSEPDNTPYTPNGAGAMPFFPAPPAPGQAVQGQVPPPRGQSVSGQHPVIPLGAPVVPGRRPAVAETSPPEVNGRIKIEDAVVEKIATLAATEVPGAVSLGELGVVTANERISLNLSVVVAYGSVVMEVARQVQGNVARIVGLMLGMQIDTVDVTVTDVRLPEPT